MRGMNDEGLQRDAVSPFSGSSLANQQELGVRSWPTWGCEASKFPWSYDSTGERGNKWSKVAHDNGACRSACCACRRAAMLRELRSSLPACHAHLCTGMCRDGVRAEGAGDCDP